MTARLVTAALLALLWWVAGTPAMGQSPVPEPAVPSDGSVQGAARLVEPGPWRVASGEPCQITVEVVAPEGLTGVRFRAEGTPWIEVLEATAQPPETTDTPGMNLTRWTLRLAVFRPGLHEAAGLLVTGMTDSGNPWQRSTGPIAVEVSRMVTSGEVSPRPSASPSTVRVRDPRPALLGGGLLLLVLGGVLSRWWQRRARPVDLPPPPPPRPAWEVALEALDALEREGLLERHEAILFHLRLSDVLKTWLGATQGVLAAEMTTTEVRQMLRSRPELPTRLVAEVLAILEESDLVKFARFEPESAESWSRLVRTRALVVDWREREREPVKPVESTKAGGPEDEGAEGSPGPGGAA
jgi:hypothetical protein